MDHNPVFDNRKDRLYLSFLAGFYEKFAQPFAWTVFRMVIGGLLVFEGWPKILHPLSQVGFLENIGFYPGWLWSPALAVVQVAGGALIVLGLMTRPAALANGIMLLVTIWFHFSHPYNLPLLSQAGIEAVTKEPELFTPAGLMRFKDGGTFFLNLLQEKAVMDVVFWSGGTFLFAAFGGGYFSLDHLLKKHF